ncbi:uncharacterized protein PAC_11134 [Phialocephala subalpina]|uniref:Uncharacterized protein n=1 Tax=Phialocephala subalpina TaxID=576137 RepID=A0A1L7X893_9HELO|nr:uncharacterized protein PAC_11134 [Phialocephala subalpina]
MKPISCMLHCILLSCTVLLSLVPAVASSFQRGDRYWNGKPQPIGIDFSFDHAVAVYADGPGNFTTIGVVRPNPDNPYIQYVHTLFNERDTWDGTSAVLNDDNEFELEEAWIDKNWSRVSSWPGRFTQDSCSRLLPFFIKFKPFIQFTFINFCFREEEYQYRPIKPRSQYAKLLSQRRIRRLRTMVPKWFRSPQPNKLSRSGFVLSIFELVEQIKEVALQNNISITSAIISKPKWIHNEMEDLFDEACLLADIEVYEQPRDRAEMAARTAPEGGTVLLLDHGNYHLDLVHAAWDDREKAHKQRGSMGLKDMGTSRMFKQLTWHVLLGYMRNTNSTKDETNWPNVVGLQHVVQEVSVARNQLKFGTEWPQLLNISERDTTVNFTEPSGRVRTVNVTSQDVSAIEARYIAEISNNIRTLLTKRDKLDEYWTGVYEEFMKTNPMSKQDIQDYLRNGGSMEKLLGVVPHPKKDDSWYETVDSVIILDKGHDAEILRMAIEKALRPNGPNITQAEQEMCVPYYAIAARGAALRARDWISYYEASFPEYEEYELEDEL